MTELARRGHAVDYWSFSEFREVIERAGARFRAYPEVPDYRERQAADNLMRLARIVMEVTERVLPAIVESFDEEKPDVILHDALAVWGAYAARVLRIPAIATVSTFVVDGRLIRRDPQLVLYGARQIVAAWRDVLPFERVRRALRGRYGSPPPGAAEMWSIHQRLNVVFTSRELQPHGELFDEDYLFVGPSLRHEPSTQFPFDAVAERPLVYVSLGTLFNQRADFFRAAVGAFADGRRNVLLSLGDSVDPASLGRLPPNVAVRRFVPQLAVLRRTALFVTHGGMNSVNEALYFDVPLVVYPQVHDQLIVARRIAELGAGVALRGRPDAATIRRAADEVLTQARYRVRASALGATLRAAGGASRAADAIERFASAEATARERAS